MYHLVCAAKYRRVVMSERVDEVLRAACIEIEKRWEIVFLEIGLDRDHAHFLIQSVPAYSPTRIRYDGEECNCARSVCESTGGEEATVGRRVLGKRVLRKHGGATQQRERDRGLYRESR